MSKKKWRRPANPDYKSPALVQKQVDDGKQVQQPTADAGQKSEQPTTAAKIVDVAGATAAAGAVPATGTVPNGGDSPLPQDAPAPSRPQYDLMVTDDEAQGFINEMTRFLGGVVKRCNRIIDSVRLDDMRDTVARDLPFANEAEDSAVETARIARNIEAAKKKLPRSHPLLALLRYGMAASRLLNSILQATKPHLFGRPSVAYRNYMHAAEASDRFLKGKVPPELMREAIANTGS